MLFLIINILFIMSDNLPEINSLWDYNKPGETEQKFLEILPKAEKSGDMNYYIQLLTQLARSQGLQKKFDEAHTNLDKAEKLLKENSESANLDTARIRYLLERGRAFNSSGVKDKAKEFFLEAFEFGKEKSLAGYTIDAAHMMGIAEPLEEGLKWNEKAIRIAEETEDEKAKNWLGSLYNNTGWSLHDIGDYEKALDYFERNVAWNAERNKGEGLRIAKWCVARTYRSLGRTEEALEMQEALLKEITDNNLEQDGYVSEEIGECLLLLGREEESVPYFKEAYEMLSQDIWLRDGEKERLERLKKLGKVE